MLRFSFTIAAFAGLLAALGVHSAAAQSGLDSMLRQLGERAIEEIIRPDSPSVTAPSNTTPRHQTQTAPAGPTGPTRAEVMEVQKLLVQLGYDPGVPDGLMGPNTAQAISAFQRDSGRPQNGVVTEGLVVRLRTAATGDGVATTTPQQSVRPSFDCERAGTPTEYAICSTPELAQLDVQIADAFAAARAGSSSPSTVVDAQRIWISMRNACRSDVDCLRAVMQERSATLSGKEPRIAQSGAIDDDGNGFSLLSENGDSAILKGEEAYTALLRRYIRANDEVEKERAFLLRFAGLGCREQGWERQKLNPFDRQEITDTAASRLSDIRSAPMPDEPLIFEYTYTLSLEDYDFETQSFPFAGGGAMTESLQPTDFCRNLARDAGEIRTETFPFKFLPSIGGKPLEPEALSDLLGGSIAQDQASARRLYEQSGFPRVNVRIVGQAGTPMLAGRHTGSFVPFTPLQAEVRLARAEDEQAPLAVFQADDFNLPDTSDADTKEADSLPKRLTALDVIELFLREHTEMLSDPTVASVYAYSSLEQVTSVEQLASRPELCVPIARLKDHEYNEFDIQELLDAAPQRALRRLNERTSSETFSVQLTGRLGTYDPSRGGFPVEGAISRRSDWNEYIQLHLITHRAPLADCLRQNAELRTPSARARDNGVLNFVPMEREAAERFVSAAPERSVSITIVLRAEEAFTVNHESVVTFEIEKAEVVAEETGRTLLEVLGDAVEAASDDAHVLWAGVTPLDGPDLFLEAVRRDARKISDEDYVNRWIEKSFCSEIRQNRDNPIRLSRLFKDNSAALETALAEGVPLGPKSIGMTWVKLGDYDLEKETFPLVGHSLDGERPLKGFNMQCRGVESQGDSAPVSYEITVNGLSDIARMGLPMSIDDADAYIQSKGGRRNRWERINFSVIIDNVRFGTVDAAGLQQVQVDAAGYRIADLSGEEILHETSFAEPSENGAGEAEVTGQGADEKQATGSVGGESIDETMVLSLLDLSIGMPFQPARDRLVNRFGAEAVVSSEANVLMVESGTCRYAAVSDPKIEAEAGSTCVMVIFGPDDTVSSIVVRNVVTGAYVDGYAAQLEERFGAPADRVLANEVPQTLILGWGPELAATANEVERDTSAGQALHALEARLTQANGVTLVTARLDADPARSGSVAADEGGSAVTPPPIEF